MLFCLLICCTYIMRALAAVYIEGPCPDVKPVQNFSLSLFAGKWYQIARYQNDFETGTCVIIDIAKENGTYVTEITDFSGDKPKQLKGYTDFAPNFKNTGFLNIRSPLFNATEGFNVLPFIILDIEYDSYAVAYECKYDERKKKNHVYVFIASRSPKFTADAKTKVDNFIKSSSYIDEHRFIWDHYDPESCRGKIQ